MLSPNNAATVVPRLVLAVGNRSRGDDALGPLAAERIEALQMPEVEVLVDHQLQVEHALDLLGRSEVVFIDASVAADPPYRLTTVAAASGATLGTHAVSAAAVLDCFRRLTGHDPPPARMLAIRGYTFDLGAPLSVAAARNLDAAIEALARHLTSAMTVGAV